jgi:branched-chain amino acid transport system permease protein
MRKRINAHTPLMVAIVSIALNLAIENGLRFFFGSDLNSFDFEIARDVQFGGIRIGPQQIDNLVIALAVAGVLSVFFTVTRVGKAMRAVADNADLARLKGIDPAKLSNLATFLGMGLAGIGGALLAVDTTVDPSTGSRLLLIIFSASIVGGMTSLVGAVLGALLIGVVSEVALMAIPPVYQSGTAFVMILLVLLFRPSGLFAGSSGIRK